MSEHLAKIDLLDWLGYRSGDDYIAESTPAGIRLIPATGVSLPSCEQLASYMTGDALLPNGQTYCAWQLARAKERRMAKIDARSERLLTSGIEVAPGVRLSSSIAATQNLQDVLLGVLAGRTVLPQAVSTVDGRAYTITDAADLQRIVTLYQSHKTSILDAGRALRAAVLAADTVEAVEAVEDTR